MSSFRILVADDHPIFLFGLCSMLSAHEGWEVCGEATDGRDAVAKCRQLKPDLLILDICMPELNGVDVARQILKDDPAQRILVLTDVDSEQVIGECLEAGVRGWVFKSDPSSDVMAAVEALQRYNSIFSSRVSHLILNGYLQRHRSAPASIVIPTLTPREREVVQLVGEGKTSKEIAAVLHVTVKTAEAHRSNLMSKLNLHSIVELVMYAVRNGIVQVHVPVVLPSPKPGIALPQSLN